ncbi:unnamed protein product [Toxocara canis]|uniref:PH domain-containing protein n=1 Tax=Toxocara canis TaxID=6265 RepID=A0A183UGD5_TOXCA|nr:unnamed protein product [Toxocara canis]
MSVQREVIKSNWLQHKVRKKSGTLIRKKLSALWEVSESEFVVHLDYFRLHMNLPRTLLLEKEDESFKCNQKIRYEEAEWVVLCVHDDRIPLLEWPTKVIDLLDSAFVTPVISDSRSFIIGFTHSSREPIELAALTPEDCSDWVHTSMATLVRLRCLNDSTNVYTALSDSAPTIYPNSTEQRPYQFSLDDEVPHSSAPVLMATETETNEVSPYEHLALAVDFGNMSTSDQNSSCESSAARVADAAKMRRKSECGKDIPPPLPPRDATLPSSPLIRDATLPSSPRLSSPRAGSVYDFPRNCVSSPKGVYGTLEHNRHSPINSPLSTTASPVSPLARSSDCGLLADGSSILSQEIAPPKEMETRTHAKRGYSIPSSIVITPRDQRSLENAAVGCASVNGTVKNNAYDIPLCIPSDNQFRSSSLVETAETQVVNSTSETSSSASPRTLKSPTPSNDLYASPVGTTLTKLTPIAIQLTLCVESIAFVEINERIWIAGWTASSDKHLAGALRIGDELVQVGGVRVEEISHLPGLFYSSSIPGSPVNLLIRQVPYGTEYTFTKTCRNYDFGVVLHKHKNKLEEVRGGSPAFQAGIRAHIVGMNGTLTSACVTHFDGRPLSLFSRNDELLNLIGMVPFMSKFTLIIQPYDFMKEIKREIKKMKNYGVFVRN